MFPLVQQALDQLGSALGDADQASTGDLRRVLGVAKQLRSRVELLETKAASIVAERERHGDGGAGLLNQVVGVSRSEAARNVRTESELVEIPAARDGVDAGEITLANASRLATAARKTSPQAVQGDSELVEMAKALPPDEFAQAAQRWTIQHQSADDLAAQHRRNRRNRQVRFWNGDDGSVQMRGSFDAEMGARIQQRLSKQAELLRQADRRRQRDRKQGVSADDPVRTVDQRMADALDGLVVSAISAAAPATLGASSDKPEDSLAAGTSSVDATPPGDTAAISPCRAVTTEIIVRADLGALLGEAGAIAEIPGYGPLPPSVLGRLACNADLSVVFFGDKLTPLWETTPSRAPTAAQRRALIARDGACIGCGTPPGECEAHHVIPWIRGGKTRIDNLVLVCWSCHDKIHDHNWRVVKRGHRYRLLPPDAAHPTNPAPSRKPTQSANRATRQPDLLRDTDQHQTLLL